MEYILKKEQTLSEVLNVAQPFDIIYLENKTYYEKIKIIVDNITIIGTGPKSCIANKDYYNKIHADNKEYLTVRTYTVMVCGSNVTFKNLTIKNLSTPNSIYGQAVALHVLGDNFCCDNCKIYGAQDTILSGPIPYDLTIRYRNLLPQDELSQKKSHQHYKNCLIAGDVDFIFGCGIAVFEDCQIHSLGKGYISAPSHPKEYPYGFVFINCQLTCEPNNVDNVYLARPWRDYGSSAFINCTIEKHIKKEGFHHWNPQRESTCKMYIYKTLSNYNSIANFAKILNEEDIKEKYNIQKILNS